MKILNKLSMQRGKAIPKAKKLIQQPIKSSQASENNLPPFDFEAMTPISLELYGLGEVVLSSQSDLMTDIFELIKIIDCFSVSCSETEITGVHKLEQRSSFKEPVIDLQVTIANDTSLNNKKHVYAFLDNARRIILTEDYCINDYFDELIRKLTELSIDLDDQIKDQKNLKGDDSYLINDKHINRITFAKVIDKFSKISPPRNTICMFSVNSIHGRYDVKSIEKRKAIDILGGKYMSEKEFTGNYLVNKITFEDIEQQLEFLLDGQKVKVFIVDKEWISKFNAGEIKLAKNDRIKARAKIEHSPLNNKPVAYYFVKVLGVNI